MNKKSSIFIFLIVFSSTFFLIHFINSGSPKSIEADTFNIQFETDANYIFVPVQINNWEYKFILDTGSGVTVFGPSIKSQLKTFVKQRTLRDIDGRPFTASIYQSPEQFKLGQFLLKGFIAFAEDANALDFSSIDGILGVDFLKNFIITVDFGNKIINFTRSEKIQDANSGIPVDIFLNTNGVPSASSKVNGIDVNFVFDTGLTSYSYLSKEIFKEVSSQKNMKIYQITMKSLSNPDLKDVRSAINANLSLSSIKYGNLTFLERNSSVLGMNFIRSHRKIIFDFPNKKIYLFPGTVNTITLPDLGITLIQKGKDFSIFSIDPNSNAYKSGLRNDDIMLKIEDVELNEKSIANLPASIKADNKGYIQILIRRSGKNQVISITPD
jgi:hypothetical protein